MLYGYFRGYICISCHFFIRDSHVLFTYLVKRRNYQFQFDGIVYDFSGSESMNYTFFVPGTHILKVKAIDSMITSPQTYIKYLDVSSPISNVQVYCLEFKHVLRVGKDGTGKQTCVVEVGHGTEVSLKIEAIHRNKDKYELRRKTIDLTGTGKL